MCLFWGDFCRPVLAAGSAWLHFWTQKDLEICEQNSCLLLPGCVEISCLQNFYVTGGDSKQLPHHFPEEGPWCVVFRTIVLWLFICLCPSVFIRSSLFCAAVIHLWAVCVTLQPAALCRGAAGRDRKAVSRCCLEGWCSENWSLRSDGLGSH